MSFRWEETTIAQIQTALQAGAVSCAELVDGYLARIAAYDRGGPRLNSIVTVNPRAQDEAARLDAELAASGSLSGPLHGVPVVVKDQVETAGIMTSFGSIALDGYIPDTDATAITKLRAAGAIILAKTAMPDFATSWFGYSSQLGTTKNPYDPTHDPGGSSGGTGAAVAANLGALGVGEDTGGSIRVPASFNNLVGLKVTPGLISRAGMSPLVEFQDSAGPMCRTVSDAAKLLEVLAGFDPADPYTATAVIAGRVPYSQLLDRASLRGARIGVVRHTFGDAADPQAAAVNTLTERALAAMTAAGASLVEVTLPDLQHYIERSSLYLIRSRHDIDAFLAARPQLPMTRLRDILAAKKYHPKLDFLEALAEGPSDPYADPEYYQRYAAREQFQRMVINAMAQAETRALVFPTAQVPAPSRAELDEGKWPLLEFPTNTLIAAQTWMPAISVPAGFTDTNLPVGIEMVGLPYREADLLSLAYAFEQATLHRSPSAHVPEL
ncbi:MAG: hypothetical protein J4F42_20620 [Desulfurellaceae bacterium]|nr:hypothetical protein [Desulfurellaceae bacterium]